MPHPGVRVRRSRRTPVRLRGLTKLELRPGDVLWLDGWPKNPCSIATVVFDDENDGARCLLSLPSATRVRADAALVRLDDNIGFRRKTSDGSISRTAWDITAEAVDINDDVPVLKVGATTGLTRGQLACVPELQPIWNGTLQKKRPYQPVYLIVGDDEQKSFGAPGDSGSMVCTTDMHPVGILSAMYFSGTRPELGVCVPIKNVLEELRVSL